MLASAGIFLGIFGYRGGVVALWRCGVVAGLDR